MRLPSQRVCVVLLMRIGDVVWGLPIVNALKRDDPKRHITWVVQSVPAALLQPHPSVDEVITFDRKKGLGELRALWRKLRPREFDLVLCCSHYIKSAIPALIARAPDKVSYGPDRASDFQWMFSNHNLPPRRARHMQERYLEFLDFLGLDRADQIEWNITLTEEERLAQTEFLAQFEGRQVVALGTTSYAQNKNWPSERFAELAAALQHDLGFGVVLVGGPGAAEQQQAREVRRAAGEGVVWGLGEDLRRLIYLLDGCSLMISVDTGPLHIARALDTPVIGLYGNTDPWRYGPYKAYEDLWIDRYNLEGPDDPADAGVRIARAERFMLISVRDVLDKVEVAMEWYLLRKEAV